VRSGIAALLVVVSLSSSSLAGWEEPFRRAVRSCDRVRVRSGGTCHRNPAEEKTLFEVTKPGRIRALVRGIEIDEAQSGFGCMCCGWPTFEFYRGEKLLAMVGFHHGRSLRWEGGAWKGDAALTGESALLLCRFLAEGGVEEPLRELEEELARARAFEVRTERRARILPRAAGAVLREAATGEEIGRALDAASGDPVKRAILWFAVYGCHEGSWHHFDPVETEVSAKLAELPGEVLGAAMGRLGDDPAARNGAGRFLFEDRRWEQVPREALDGALPSILSHALAHPRVSCRRSAMAAAARIGGEAAIAALRLTLAGEERLREMPEADRVDAGGRVVFRAMAKELREAIDDRVAAAWLLHGMGDRESVPAIRALPGAEEGPDREILAGLRKAIREEELERGEAGEEPGDR
jgi:hypothetical protein